MTGDPMKWQKTFRVVPCFWQATPRGNRGLGDQGISSERTGARVFVDLVDGTPCAFPAPFEIHNYLD